MEPAELAKNLIAELRKAVPMLVRTASPSGDALDAVLSRDELSRCCALLSQALGPAAKDFNQPAKLQGKMQRAVEAVGGIRLEQCLFLSGESAPQMAYAALWPWASDATRVTLKVGLLNLK